MFFIDLLSVTEYVVSVSSVYRERESTPVTGRQTTSKSKSYSRNQIRFISVLVELTCAALHPALSSRRSQCAHLLRCLHSLVHGTLAGPPRPDHRLSAGVRGDQRRTPPRGASATEPHALHPEQPAAGHTVHSEHLRPQRPPGESTSHRHTVYQ